MASGASGKRLHLMFKYVHTLKTTKENQTLDEQKKTAINCICSTCASVYD